MARRIQDSSTRDANASDEANTEGAFQVPNPWRTGSKVWHLQRNVRALPQETLHEITWTDRDDPERKEETTEALHATGTGWGYGFVRELTPGDRIAIYARAQVSIKFNYCSDLPEYACNLNHGKRSETFWLVT